MGSQTLLGDSMITYGRQIPNRRILKGWVLIEWFDHQAWSLLSACGSPERKLSASPRKFWDLSLAIDLTTLNSVESAKNKKILTKLQ